MLPEFDTSLMAPPEGKDSVMAMRDHTKKPASPCMPPQYHKQLHNEYVVFEDAAVYPEFVLRVRRMPDAS